MGDGPRDNEEEDEEDENVSGGGSGREEGDWADESVAMINT